MNDYNAIFEGKLPEPGDFPACYAFSLHKAGSSMMFGMIEAVARVEGIPAITFPDILFEAGVIDNNWSDEEYLLKYFLRGRVYFGFRYLPTFFSKNRELIDQSRSIILVRDPRDALVSQYFSFQGSHVLPEVNKDVYLESFKKTSQFDIDEYVLASAAGYKNKISDYIDFVDMKSMRVFRYEDVIFNKKRFLEEIFLHFMISVSNETIDEVSAKFDLRPEIENVKAHVRKVTPGDHKDKLKKETIEKLNQEFAEICAHFGYDLR